EPHRSPGTLVVSYTTVSPLPVRGRAVCSLWHCPAGHPGWALPTTLLCGARTFLGTPEGATRPPGRLVCRPHTTPLRAVFRTDYAGSRDRPAAAFRGQVRPDDRLPRRPRRPHPPRPRRRA